MHWVHNRKRMNELIIRAVRPDDWPAVERLFGENGACGGCWCMHWHAPPGEKAWEAMKGSRNRSLLKAMIEGGDCPALLALDGEVPIGWCRAGPAGSFSRLRRSRKLWRDAMADWSVVCFFVIASHRGRGVASMLLRRAAELAFASGARSIEGYPSVPTTDRMPAAFAWTGVPKVFEVAGFVEVPHNSGARRIYRMERLPEEH